MVCAFFITCCVYKCTYVVAMDRTIASVVQKSGKGHWQVPTQCKLLCVHLHGGVI